MKPWNRASFAEAFRWGRYAVRLGLVIAICWVGYRTAVSLTTLVNRPATDDHLTMASVPGDAPLLAPLYDKPGQGYWTFAGMQWSFRQITVADTELSEALDRPRKWGDPPTDLAREEEKALLASLAIFATVTTEGDHTAYKVHWPTCRLRIVATPAAQADQRIVGGLAAWESSPGQWSLMELQPARTSRSEFTAGLLPIPTHGRLLCRRSGADGQPLLEIARLHLPVDDLLRLWQGAGWEVETSPNPGVGSFQCVCSKGDRCVQVWGPLHGRSVEAVVMTCAAGGHTADR